MCHDDVHACSEHSKAEFKPEPRAIVTIQFQHSRKFVSITVPLSAMIPWDNMLNLKRAVDQMIENAFNTQTNV